MNDKERASRLKKMAAAGSHKSDMGFWQEIWLQIRLVVRLLRDPEVPFYLKVVPFLAFIYLLSPIDLVPDALIGLGQLDDVTLLLVGARVFVQLAPAHVVERHRRAIEEEAQVRPAETVPIIEAIVIDPEPVED